MPPADPLRELRATRYAILHALQHLDPKSRAARILASVVPMAGPRAPTWPPEPRNTQGPTSPDAPCPADLAPTPGSPENPASSQK